MTESNELMNVPEEPTGAMSPSNALGYNLHGEIISPWDLVQARIPAGGGTKWRLSMQDDVESIEGVILLIGRRRAYWVSNVPSGSAPDCLSLDGIEGRGTPGGKCATCPQNQWGTSVSGQGKACREMRLLLVLPLTGELVLPLVVVISPASLVKLRQYLLMLAARNLRYDCAITRFTLAAVTKNKMTFSQAQFHLMRKLEPAEADKIKDVALMFASAFGAVIPEMQNGNAE